MLINTNVELRFPVWRLLSGALFLDGGNVWSRPRNFKLSQLGLGNAPIDPNQMRWAAGGGLRVRTPVGPFRFDAGYRLREALGLRGEIEDRGVEFHISLGQAY